MPLLAYRKYGHNLSLCSPVMPLSNGQKSIFADYNIKVTLTFDILDVKCNYFISFNPIRHLCEILS